MAEVFGIVAGVAGIVTFVGQVTRCVDLVRQLRQQHGGFASELESLGDRLELLRQKLLMLDTNDTSAGIDVAPLQRRFSGVEGILHDLHAQVKRQQDPRWKRPPSFVQAPRIKERLQELRDHINEVVLDLTLVITSSFSQTRSLHAEPQDSEKAMVACSPAVKTQHGADLLAPDPLLRSSALLSTQRNACGPNRTCSCSCHRIHSLGGRFWGVAYTPFSALLGKCSRANCSTNRIRLDINLAFSQYGVPFAIRTGIDLLFGTGGCTLRPALTLQRIVRHTSRGFEILWLCRTYRMGFEEARDNLTQLYRSDPSFIHHVNPNGHNYVHELICHGPGFASDDQFQLLELLVADFGISLGSEDQSFLAKCANWIGEGPHFALLQTILALGFDPNSINGPSVHEWPSPLNPNWYCAGYTPDPLFVDYISALSRGNPGFPGVTPLHAALLHGSDEDVRLWIARSQPIGDDLNFLDQSPLHLAAYRARHIHLLLESGHPIDVPDAKGLTPLIYATVAGHTDVVLYLLSHGAAPVVHDPYTKGVRSFLSFALERNHRKLIVESLPQLRNTLDSEYLQYIMRQILIAILGEHLALDEERTGLFLKVLPFCDDVNFRIFDQSKGCDNLNLMHYVRNLDEAEALVRHGFNNFNSENSRGKLSIFSFADSEPDAVLIRYCIDQGTNVTHRDQKGFTVLWYLLSRTFSGRWHIRDSWDSVVLMLTAGIDIFSTDDCRCPCAPTGCAASSVFKFGGLYQPWYCDVGHVWTFEWLTLVEELRGVAAAKQELLSLIRRHKIDQTDIAITHVCCHRGHSPTDRIFRIIPHTTSRLSSEDEAEILEEESEFIYILEQDMAQLTSVAYEDLIKEWMVLLKQDRDQLAELDKAERQARRPSREVATSKYGIDHDRDEFFSQINGSLPRKIIDLLPTVRSYALWLEHGYAEWTDKKRFRGYQSREIWYQRRMRWFVQLINILGIAPDRIEDSARQWLSNELTPLSSDDSGLLSHWRDEIAKMSAILLQDSET